MKRTCIHLLHAAAAAALLLAAHAANAQLSVSPQTDVDALAGAITGQGVSISNAVIDCHPQGFGEFSYTGGVLGVNEGIVLTSGTIAHGVGPNNVENRTFEQGTPGNPLLNTVTGRTTFDACRLEFDVIPGGDTLRFNFAFASEEYNEWVGSQYNDVFGFFISGPGIVGDPGIGNEKNIALIPNTTQAVTINNVNNGANDQYYLDNAGGQHIQYDGITQGLQAVAAVQPCQTYRLKLIVADASDRKFDSGVFIERLESNAVTMAPFTASGFPDLIEGCHPGGVRFTRQVITPDALDVPFFLQGTAIHGTDYPLVGTADPAVAKIATIPGGQGSVDVLFDPVADGIPEGLETIKVLLGSSICPGFYLDSLELTIRDSLETSITPPVTICPGGSTTLTADGALNYSWTPGSGLASPNTASTTAAPTTTTSYTVNMSVGACTTSANTQVIVSAMTLSATTVRPLCQGQSNGAVNLSVGGGTAPYTFAWSGPNGFTADTEDLSGVGAGTYTVTVTDGSGCSSTQSFNLTSPAALVLTTTPSILPMGQNISCFNGADGSIALNIAGGSGPYQVNWSGPNGFSSSSANLTGLSAGTYEATVTDANGCTANTSRTLVQPPALAPTLQSSSNASCNGSADGTATISVAGGIPPYAVVWNTQPVQNGTTASGLMAGSYSATVTDGYGCTANASITIDAPAALQVTVTNVSDVFQCQGQQNPNGSATAVVNGGTAPYDHVWNTNPAQSGETALFNSGGSYTVTVTDANGCTGMAEVTVTQPGISNIAVTGQTNVSCALNDGSATVAISGGSNVQSIMWNTTPAQTGPTASGLAPGTYTATAQHADGCQSVATVTITGPSEALAVSIDNVMGVSCAGVGNGTAEAIVTGGEGPYAYQWNNDPVLNTANVDGLTAGPISVLVTDALGCTATAGSNVPGPQTALSVAITGFTNVLCFETAQGTANAQASGGTPPYTYSWNSDPVQIGPEAIELPEGSYTVTVTDANGCSANTNVSIGGPQFGVQSIIESFSDVTCFGGSDGWATIDVSGGSGSYTITWMVEPPQFGTTVTGLPAGDYTVMIEDNNGCDIDKFVDFTIGGPAAPLAIDLALSDHNGFNVSCHDAADGSIMPTITGGTLPYFPWWTDAFGNGTGAFGVSGLDAGVYTLTVTDGNGCVIDTTVTLTAPPPIVVEADVTTATCQGSATGAIALTLSGGLPPLDLVWSGPNGFSSTSLSISDLDAGVYTATVTDANGCTAIRAIDVSEPGLFVVNGTMSSYPGGWQISCAGASDGSITMDVSGGTGVLSYAWTGPNGFSSSDQDLSGLAGGTYTVTITDENGCSALGAYTLNAPAPVNANLQPGTYGAFNLSCAGASDAFINNTITGGTVEYDVQWTGPDGFTANTVSIFNLAPGTYTVSVTDVNGCSTSASSTLVAPTPMIATLAPSSNPSGDAVACHGSSTGSIDLSVSGGAQPYTTTWEGPDGFSSTAQDIAGLVAGTYAATVVDANGCTQVLPITLTEPAPITLSGTVSDQNGHAISCADASDGTISIAVGGGAGDLSVQWNGPNGFTSAATDLSGLAAGTYTVTATDLNGCTLQQSFVLVEPDVLSPSITLDAATTCTGAGDAAVTLDVVGGTAPIDVAWVGPNGFTSSDLDLTDLEPGSYTAFVTDANGCTAEESMVISEPEPLAIELSPLTYSGDHNISCSGAADGAVDLSVTGGTAPFTYLWTDGLGFTSMDEDISNVGAGVYQVVVTDANGCSLSQFITLTGPTPLGITASTSGVPGAEISCAGGSDGSIAVVTTGGTVPHEVAWSNGAIGNALNDLAAGSYTATVTDANGCTANITTTLEAPESIQVSLTPSLHPSGFAVSCADGADGSITPAVTGGTTDYAFEWTGPNGFTASTVSLSGLQPGAYNLLVTDANGCEGNGSITLDAPPALDLSLNATTFNGGYHVSCMGFGNGQASAQATGGHGALEYNWSGPGGFTATGPQQGSLTAGSYTVTVSDDNGCSATTDILLTEPDALDPVVLVSDIGNGYNVGCAGNDGSIAVIVNGGTPEFAYSWSNGTGFGSIEPGIDGLAAGVYHLTLTDANGCVFETNVTLEQPEPILASFTTVPTICPGDASGSLSVAATGGVEPFTYAWSGPNGFSSSATDLNDLEAGTYTLAVIDALGCSSTFSTAVTGPAPLSSGSYVSFYGIHNLQCAGDSTGTIDLSPVGGTAPYAVTVSGPGGLNTSNTSLTGLVAGEYAVSIVDANGCAMDTTITLTQPELSIDTELSVSIFPSGTNVSCFGASDGWISADVTGGSGNYTFTWRGPDSLEWNTPTITGLPAGNYAYELVVTDANQCSFFTEVVLNQPDSALVADVNTSSYTGGLQVSCNGAIDGSITLQPGGGNGSYSVDWTGPNGFAANGGNLNDLAAGTYIATVTDVNGCLLEVPVELLAPEPLTVEFAAFTFPSGSNISCHGSNDGSITATIGGGVAPHILSWSGPDGYTNTQAGLDALAPGEYCLTVTDANGCTTEACITLSGPDALTAQAVSSLAACGENVGTVDLSVSGGSQPFNFNWNNGATTEDLDALAAGTYQVTVSDVNGCTVAASATVGSTPAVLLVSSVSDNDCHGGTDGAIALQTTSGTAPFTYVWDHGAQGPILGGLAAGPYSVTVSDANGCTAELDLVVDENEAIRIDVQLSSYSGGYNVSSYGGDNGSITTNVTGGTAPYAYSWSTGSGNSSLFGLPAGTYTLEVTDANGCTATIIVEVTQPEDLEMPTGYSPNGDGANDFFFIRGLDAYPSNTFVVLNRWGNVVYDRLNYRNDWNGENARGQALPDGTYFVILTVNDGARTLQGYVDLRR